MNNLNILYEDNHIIVVVKEPNILSQSDNTHDISLPDIIKSYLKEKYHKEGNVFLGIVHRLDRPVGGIMVYAKTSKAASRLSEQIRVGDMHKKYYAIVHGYLTEKEGIFNDKIEKLDAKKVLLNTPNGKEATLKYKVLTEKDNLSLIDIDLLTGRYHQIRLQFSSRGHALYGDALYGMDKNKQIALYAYKLSFYHPTTKELLTFENKPFYGIFNNFIN